MERILIKLKFYKKIKIKNKLNKNKNKLFKELDNLGLQNNSQLMHFFYEIEMNNKQLIFFCKIQDLCKCNNFNLIKINNNKIAKMMIIYNIFL